MEWYSFDVNWKWRLLVNEIWNHPQTVSSQYVPTKVFILNICTFLYILFNFNLLSPEIICCVWSIVVFIQTWFCNLCMASIPAFYFMVSTKFISVNIKKDLVFFFITVFNCRIQQLKHLIFFFKIQSKLCKCYWKCI